MARSAGWCWRRLGVFPVAMRRAGLVPVYFEAAAVITPLVLLGQVLELRARERTGGATRALLDLASRAAHRIHASGDKEDIRLEQVQAGDRPRVRPGRSVPREWELTRRSNSSCGASPRLSAVARRPSAGPTACPRGSCRQ